MRTSLITVALVAALFAAPAAQAGIWANFWGAVGKTVEDYNTDILATGDAVNAALKEGKLNDAFMAFDKNYLVTGEHALANSKAVYKALKEIVLWVPNQIKKLWEKFVAILQKIRDKLAALNQPPAPPQKTGPGAEGDAADEPGDTTKASGTYGDEPTTRGWQDNFSFKPLPVKPAADDPVASTPAAEATRLLGLGDGFVERFKAQSAIDGKLQTYGEYRGTVYGMQTWIGGLQADHQKALEPNFQKVSSECSLLEDLLFEEIGGSIEGDGAALKAFIGALRGADASEAPVLFGSLANKVGKRLNLAVASDRGDKNLGKLAADFTAATAAAGIK